MNKNCLAKSLIRSPVNMGVVAREALSTGQSRDSTQVLIHYGILSAADASRPLALQHSVHLNSLLQAAGSGDNLARLWPSLAF